MKNYLLLLVASATITFSTLVTVSHIRAVPCDTGAKVCNYVISTGLLHNTVCLNGVQSTSLMPESGGNGYVVTSAPCGAAWRVSFGIPYEMAGDLCGTTASPLCE